MTLEIRELVKSMLADLSKRGYSACSLAVIEFEKMATARLRSELALSAGFSF